ncbi:hypothetical protein OBBRIDRAFT_822384 [Obba rivulosa]|uniref:Uncharacterized protein n=1 Tax=Obba rivulosa TaxID=1052685 RepID=A0A8E2DVI9_9APHY|nr:hypothetical protein OBBRIDRAFT_822384 [Obba rivulosa]
MSSYSSSLTSGASRAHLRSRARVLKASKPRGVQRAGRWDSSALDSDESDFFPESPRLLVSRGGESDDDSDVPHEWLDGHSRLATINKQRHDVEVVSHRLARLGIHPGGASDAESSAGSSAETLVDALLPSLSSARLGPLAPSTSRPSRVYTPSLASDSEWTDTDGSYSGYESSRDIDSRRRATARQILQKAAPPRNTPVVARTTLGATRRRAAAPYPAPAVSLTGRFAYPTAASDLFACGAWNGDLLAASARPRSGEADADHNVEAVAAHMSRLDLNRSAMRLDHYNGAWFPFTFNCAGPY